MSNNALYHGSEVLAEIWSGYIERIDVPLRSMLQDAHIVSFDGSAMVAEVAPFTRDFLTKPDRYLALDNALRAYTGRSEAHITFLTSDHRVNDAVEAPYEVAPSPATTLPENTVKPANYAAEPPMAAEVSQSVPSEPAQRKLPAHYADTRLREDLTFDSFVKGDTNNVAAATARSAAEHPAETFNPLFFYSGVGLGKTHLMNAIGNYVIQRDPTKMVLYISAEQFTNELVESLRDSQQKKFRDKYRNLDLLLIDDIQFIVTKEKTQEEFFHTFNELHAAKKQIVISSDRPPSQMPNLMDRLRSRLGMGMTVDIQPPDLETRIAILRKKAESSDLAIDAEVYNFIAEQFYSNIRELEGALNRVIIYCRVLNKPVTLDTTKQALSDQIGPGGVRTLDMNTIKRVVCQYFGITELEITGPRREQRVVKPRQIAMYLCKEMTGSSYPEIGDVFGGRDHTTVLHAYRQVAQRLNDPFTKTSLTNLRERLR